MKPIARALWLTLLYIALLLGIYALHVRYFRVDVVLYSSVFDAMLAAVLTVAIAVALKALREFSALERVLLLAVWLLGGYAFAISIPTVIDRSLSFYILEKLQQRGGAIRESAFREIFTHEYVEEHRLVDVRLTEQLESGTILINNGCVHLTEKGERLATASRGFRLNLLPKQRLLKGVYSDDLTDPFRNSATSADYTCH